MVGQDEMVMVNLGAGRRPFHGWINVDTRAGKNIDHVQHLDGSGWILGTLGENSVDRFAAIHVIEHLKYPLEMMYRAWEYAKDGALFDLVVPHGSDDEAWGDPTHVRPYYEVSFDYFARPMHWMNPQADYRADWEVVRTQHIVDETIEQALLKSETADEDRMWLIKQSRNQIRMLHVTLKAVKPARDATYTALADMAEGRFPNRQILSMGSYLNQNPEYRQFHQSPDDVWSEDGALKYWGYEWQQG